MKRGNPNSISTYVLITCLAVALLLGQMFKLHMHITHDDASLSTTAGHIVDLHVDTTAIHGSMHDNHHGHNLEESQHTDEINISFSSMVNMVKKSMSYNQFVFFFFIISIVLNVSQLSCFLRIRYFTSKQSSHYYLFQPPLRAPPLHLA